MPQYQRLYRADSQVISTGLIFSQVFFLCSSKITWFCGTSEACRTLGHPGSVQLAISNIERDFIVVGVLEEVKNNIIHINFVILITDGEDDSSDGVSNARVPGWAWSALGRQSGDKDLCHGWWLRW